MPKLSAGIIVVRVVDDAPQFLLVHPGGPFWKNKDEGAWSIPKGEYEPDDDPLAAATREFEEELGVPPPPDLQPIGSVKQAGGKVVMAWCGFGDLDVAAIVSNTFEIEWPPRSGRTQTFPEVDRAGWFTVDEALVKILSSQQELLTRAAIALGCDRPDSGL